MSTVAPAPPSSTPPPLMRPAASPPGRSPRVLRVAAWFAGCTLLAAVFAAYLASARMVELADRIWACF